MFKTPEQFRVTMSGKPPGLPDESGAFIAVNGGREIRCIASKGDGWEHVSVTVNAPRCPTWDEMCLVKSWFWDDEDCVIQYHPPKSEYVNVHPFCLHMWRPDDGREIVRPPKLFI